MSGDVQPGILAARSLRNPPLMGISPRNLKPLKPVQPIYGGFVIFQGGRHK